VRGRGGGAVPLRARGRLHARAGACKCNAVTARVPVTPLDGGGAVRVGFRVEGLGLGLGVRD
jgi:hypothetical protein